MGLINFTDEELIFAVHHDLGKVGDLDNDYYIPQDRIRRKNRGEIFKHNQLFSI